MILNWTRFGVGKNLRIFVFVHMYVCVYVRARSPEFTFHFFVWFGFKGFVIDIELFAKYFRYAQKIMFTYLYTYTYIVIYWELCFLWLCFNCCLLFVQIRYARYRLMSLDCRMCIPLRISQWLLICLTI